jgi:threonine/homoserine/homoserine lactone efflux protein
LFTHYARPHTEILTVPAWRGGATGDRSTQASSRLSRLPAFALALITQLSNPKTAVVYGSIFAALLPASPPLWLLLALPPLIFLVETGWYLAVALVFSTPAPRSLYLAGKLWVDRVTGAVMGGLGARLIWEAALSRD